MAFKILVILAALAVCARGAVVAAPLAVAPYASSYAAHVTHHSVASPVVVSPLIAAPVAGAAAPLVTAPAASVISAPVSAPIISSVVPQYVSSANVLLK